MVTNHDVRAALHAAHNTLGVGGWPTPTAVASTAKTALAGTHSVDQYVAQSVLPSLAAFNGVYNYIDIAARVVALG